MQIYEENLDFFFLVFHLVLFSSSHIRNSDIKKDLLFDVSTCSAEPL